MNISAEQRSKSSVEMHPNAMQEQMTENKKPLKPEADDMHPVPKTPS